MPSSARRTLASSSTSRSRCTSSTCLRRRSCSLEDTRDKVSHASMLSRAPAPACRETSPQTPEQAETD
eukprot:8256849-Pyramimonas_sp.AAC.1